MGIRFDWNVPTRKFELHGFFHSKNPALGFKALVSTKLKDYLGDLYPQRIIKHEESSSFEDWSDASGPDSVKLPGRYSPCYSVSTKPLPILINSPYYVIIKYHRNNNSVYVNNVTFPVNTHFLNQTHLCNALTDAVRETLKNNGHFDGFRHPIEQVFLNKGRIVEDYLLKKFVESPRSLLEKITKHHYKIRWSNSHGQAFHLTRPSLYDSFSQDSAGFMHLLGFRTPIPENDHVISGIPATNLQESGVMQDVYFTWDPEEMKIRADLFWLDSEGQNMEVILSPAFQALTLLPAKMEAKKQIKVVRPGEVIIYKTPDDLYDWTNIGSTQSYATSSKQLISDDVYSTSRFTQATLNCSLVDRVRIGKVQRPLLEIIPLQVANYQHRGGLSPPMYDHEPKNLKYRPLNQGSISEVKFTIEDEHGEPLPLEPKQASVVTIRFRKK
jgi:hypothetical protein